MEKRRRQAVFYFVAAGLFGLAFVTQARHGLGSKAIVAALLTVILIVLGVKLRREEGDQPDA
jgi:hypothetical protein